MIRKILLLGFIIALSVNAITITKERGVYLLDFDKVYTTYVHQDIELCITLPDGYKFTHSMCGSVDFISALPLQNVMYITKKVDHNISTNITMNVTTPEGLDEQLIFKVKSGKKTPRVLAIHFVRPNYSRCNKMVEAIKSQYSDQLDSKIEQVRNETTIKVRKQTLVNQLPVFLDCKRGDLKARYKGAEASVEGIVISDGMAYVYVKGTISSKNCDIVQLAGIKQRKTINSAQLFETVTLNENTALYIYEVPGLSLDKSGSITLLIKIWSKLTKLKITVS